MTERRAHRPIWQQTWLWVVVVTGVGAGFLFWVMRPPPPPTMPAEEEARAAVAFDLPLPDDPSVAVTTFGSEADALPGADIAREVVAELARDPDLFVIHFDSSARFGAETPVRDVAAALGVRFVVQGALTLRRDTVRFSGSVTDAVSAEDVWKGTWRHEWQEFSTLPATLAALIRLAVTGALTTADPEDAVRPRDDAPVVDPEAWSHYLRGRGLAAARTLPANAEAEAAFAAALAAEPSFAAARVELAFTRYREQQGFETDLTGPARPELEAEVRTALADTPTNERGHELLSRLKMLEYTYFRRGAGEVDNRQQAMDALERAVELAPGNADLLVYRTRMHTFHHWRGHYARDYIEDALRRHPAHDWTYDLAQAQNLQLMSFYDEALAVIEPLTEAHPDNFRLHREAALVHGLVRNLEAGRAHMEAMMRIDPDYAMGWENENAIHFARGNFMRDIEALRRVGLP